MQTIYQPKGKAREYSPLALNIYNGCDHECEYCYVKSIPYFRNIDNTKPVPRPGLLPELEKYLRKHEITKQVLLSFTSDPYCRQDVMAQATRDVLDLLLSVDTPVAILSKGGDRCFRDMDLFKRFSHIKIGATLTFDNHYDSQKWEPGASLPVNRMNTLRRLHEEGITTWASFEPVIDPAQSLRLIKKTLPFIDQYKIGKWNHDKRAHAIDWRSFGTEAVNILRANNKAFYVKEDLQPFIDGLTADETDMNHLSLDSGEEQQAATERTGQFTLI